LKFNSDSKILFILAHPDDEVLGAGGMISKVKSFGASIRIVWLGEGVSARFSKNQYDSEDFKKASEIRKNGAINAMKVLDVSDYSFGDWHCLRFDQIPFLDITKKIEKEIFNFEPNLIVTHNPVEVNIDHVITFKAVEAAARPIKGKISPAIWGCEIPCSGRWTLETKFIPNVYVQIEDFIENKILAWSKYEGEARHFPFPRSDEGLITLAKYRGMEAGVKYAEAFKSWREVF
jgi:LmbE family N-acetylglucosaminyl deacetylase